MKVIVVEDLGADSLSSTAPAAVEGTPNNLIVRVSGKRQAVRKGDTVHITTEPAQRARVRHRDR